MESQLNDNIWFRVDERELAPRKLNNWYLLKFQKRKYWINYLFILKLWLWKKPLKLLSSEGANTSGLIGINDG